MATTGRDTQLLGEYHALGYPVQVWTARAPLPRSARFAAYTAELTPDEHSQAGRIGTGAARAQYVTGRALARRVLSRHVRAPVSDIRFGATEEGRPFLADPPFPELDFNLSHSGRLTVLAVTRGCRVGVDIEQMSVERDFPSIAAGFFSRDEYESWSAAGTADRTALWYRTWTRREAYVKATGAGLRDIADDHHGRGSAWADIPLEPAQGHVGCVVLIPPPPAPSLREVKPT
ncbi:4'-phosphopantetheinyl transferase family protein [Streptomyces sp. NBC_00859]|uniref:4'-phosphopantetheinyl transferase family protein n=1 Tax=Streptomyces sp. NBC_00859 TaxID=2903682 RepID=UPI00386E5246|nr:4'-phosphopantetheinyl transferase superfamily protein [Streptomyces sp. NBC_00859]